MESAWFVALAGGVLIGMAATMLMLFNGRVLGVCGIVTNAFLVDGDAVWRWCFLAGLVVSPFVAGLIPGIETPIIEERGLPLTLAAGLLVGLGTNIGSGCTSGHGVCGLARFSKRSLVAVLCFMSSAIITVFVVRHVLGGGA